MNNHAPLSNKNRTRNLILVIGAVLLVAVICCCLVMVIILAVDPFQWNLLGRLTGKGKNPAAEAVPADAGMFMGLNLLNATPAKLDRVIVPFKNAAKEAGLEVEDTQSMQDQLDTWLQEELGISVQDITPWIGQYAGLGFFDFGLDASGSIEEIHLVFAVEARDKSAADDFLLKLKESLSESTGAAVQEAEVKGVKVYELEDPFQPIAFCRSKNLVLLATGRNDLERAIAAQQGVSINDHVGYAKLSQNLPGDRALTIFINFAQYRQLLEPLLEEIESDLPSQLNLEQLMGIYWTDLVASISIVDEGLQMDVFSAYNLSEMPEDQRLVLESLGNKVTSHRLLPENTLFYYQGSHLDLTWKSLRDLYSQGISAEDFDESMELFKEQFGFNPDTELFPALDGEWAIGIFPSSEGILAEMAELPMGFAFLAQTSRPDMIKNTLEALSAGLKEQGMQVTERAVKNQTIFTLGVPEQDFSLVSYGLHSSYLTVASNEAVVENMITRKAVLADNAKFQQTWKAFSTKMQPSFYLNLQDALGTLREQQTALNLREFNQATAYIEPIQTIAIAVAPMRANLVHSRLVIFLEQP